MMGQPEPLCGKVQHNLYNILTPPVAAVIVMKRRKKTGLKCETGRRRNEKKEGHKGVIGR